MKKPFILGFVFAALIALAVRLPGNIEYANALNDMTEHLTVFADINELGFLQSYEIEKLEPEMPDGATDAYCARVSYKGSDYKVTAYVFDSEESAMRFMWGDELYGKVKTPHRTEMDRSYDTGAVSMVNGGSYCRIDGDGSARFMEFVKFVCAHMQTPVKGV